MAFIQDFRMPLVVEINISIDPVDIGLFAADAVMPASNAISNLVEQASGVYTRL